MVAPERLAESAGPPTFNTRSLGNGCESLLCLSCAEAGNGCRVKTRGVLRASLCGGRLLRRGFRVRLDAPALSEHVIFAHREPDRSIFDFGDRRARDVVVSGEEEAVFGDEVLLIGRDNLTKVLAIRVGDISPDNDLLRLHPLLHFP